MGKFKPFWNLVPDTNDESILNMYVYGEICSASSFFGSQDDVVAGRFIEDLNKYPGIETINVYINSPGGSVFAAAAIINQLRKHPACVHTWCDGICASAAVGILMAANDKCRHMSKATMLMIHNPSSKVQGDQKTFIKAADLLAKVKDTLVSIYEEATGLSREQLSDMMDAETYLSAQEALSLNFVDSITEDMVTYDFTNQGSIICNGTTIDVAAHLNVDNLKAHLEELSEINNTHYIVGEGGPQNMNFEELLASLSEENRGVIMDALNTRISPEAHQATQDELHALQEANAQLTSQVADLTAQLEAAQEPTATTGEDPVVAQMSPEAQALLAQARADAIAAQTALAQMQEASAFASFKETFAEFSNLPLTDDHLKAIQILSKNNEDMYAELRELLKVANTAMEGNFKAVGSDQGTDLGGTDAYDVIEQKVNAYRGEHQDASYNDALKAVLRENPDLYDSYRQGLTNN